MSVEVAIAGAGPTGLMLAAELALADVDVVVLEARPGPEVIGSRAGGLHARTLELLDQRGIVERFIAEGTKHPAAMFADATLDLADQPTRHPYTLGLFQRHIERLLRDWAVGELGVRVEYGVEVVGFEQDAGGAERDGGAERGGSGSGAGSAGSGDAGAHGSAPGVDVRLADGGTLRAGYLVGCDGGRSAVRKAAGIDFPGWDASRSCLIAEVEAEEPEMGLRHAEWGICGVGPGEGEMLRMVVTEREIRAGDPDLDDLRRALVDVYGSDFGVHDPTWISRFTDATRQAAAYREGRVLLAGDAAHIHYPAGGQGVQHGINDAVNLGWKLARVVQGTSPEALLDTYEAERRPPTARALRVTMAAGALHRGDPRTTALREQLTELAAMDEPRRTLGAERIGLDIAYDLGEGHPLLGRRMPDLDLTVDGEPKRVFEYLHDAKPLLLVRAAGDARRESELPDVFAPWSDQARRVEANYADRCELPVIGEVAAPAAILVRPDGHVAWVGDCSDFPCHGVEKDCSAAQTL
jgi:3-(3-hydroxy-phenyl)propionate hydroxylase